MKRDEGMRDRILDVAQELVQRVGANGMSYQDLSLALGITKPSIHYHFPNKADLLEQLVRRYSSRFLAIVDRILEAEETGMEKLRRYVSLFEATLERSGGEQACPCGMLGAEAFTLGESTLRLLQAFYEENESRLRAMLETGLQDGSFSFPGSTAATASLLFAALEGALMTARVRGGVEGFRATTTQLLLLLTP